jgi:hypothetical protein
LSPSQTIFEYVNALKWPVVVTAGIYYFRKPFSKILDHISTAQKGELKGPVGIGASWDNTLKEVDAAIDQAQQKAPVLQLWHSNRSVLPEQEAKEQPGLLGQGQVPYWPGLSDLAHVSPQAAVVLAFTQVEQVLRGVARQQHVERLDRMERMGAMQIARRLELPDEIQQALRQLSDLRNEVIHHNAVPDETMAIEYVASAKRLYEYIAFYGFTKGVSKAIDETFGKDKEGE